MGKHRLKDGPAPGEGGAPRKVIDIEVMCRAAAIGCTSEEIAALLGIGRATFYKHLLEDPGLQTAIDEARGTGRETLRRLQWHRAEAGSDTMLIWLGKQLLKQTDRQEIAVKDADVDPATLTDSEILERLAKLRSRNTTVGGDAAADGLPEEPIRLVH